VNRSASGLKQRPTRATSTRRVAGGRRTHPGRSRAQATRPSGRWPARIRRSSRRSEQVGLLETVRSLRFRSGGRRGRRGKGASPLAGFGQRLSSLGGSRATSGKRPAILGLAAAGGAGLAAFARRRRSTHEAPESEGRPEQAAAAEPAVAPVADEAATTDAPERAQDGPAQP
jgi:hypothetical protein